MKPRSRDYNVDDDLPIIYGHADGLHHPFELLEEEQEQLAAEHRDALARKRPAGFQAEWPDEPAASHLRIA